MERSGFIRRYIAQELEQHKARPTQGGGHLIRKGKGYEVVDMDRGQVWGRIAFATEDKLLDHVADQLLI